MHFCEKLQKHPELIKLNYILRNYKEIKNSKDIDFNECFSYITNNKTKMKDSMLYLTCVAIIKAFKRKLNRDQLDSIRDFCNNNIKEVTACSEMFKTFDLSDDYIPLKFGRQKKIVLSFGTFDLFHIGHLNIITRAKSLGDVLIIGISSDELNYKKKSKNTIYSFEERKKIVENIKGVDFVFKEESLEKKAEYLKDFKADILVMGDDWKDKFDYLSDICKVTYLPRTPTISTTNIVESIRK